MKDVTGQNFGLLIAYIVPGVTALLGAAEFSETVRGWLMGPAENGPTVGGFLYVTLAAVAAGLTVSTVRWAVIDTLHHCTGIPRPKWDFTKLETRASAFNLIVEHQYRYFQFYGNMDVALAFVLASRLITAEWIRLGFTELGIMALISVFFAGSRDTLRSYYERGSAVLGPNAN